MIYPPAEQYRILLKHEVDQWEYDVEHKDKNGYWSSFRTGKAFTMKRAIKKARNKIPIEVIHSQ